jgi:branched-subunit amino acid transport protein
MSTALATMTLLAVVCWVFRVLFIVVVPAERLPEGARRALEHLAPAVLAALVAVETESTMSGGDALTGLFVLLSVLAIAVAVRLTGSLPLAITLGLGAALLIDLVVVA